MITPVESLSECATYEVFRIVMKTPGHITGVPDPQENFDGCVNEVANRIRAVTLQMDEKQQLQYFTSKAREMVSWCAKTKVPPVLTKKASKWLRSLEKARGI